MSALVIIVITSQQLAIILDRLLLYLYISIYICISVYSISYVKVNYLVQYYLASQMQAIQLLLYKSPIQMVVSKRTKCEPLQFSRSREPGYRVAEI